MLLFARERGYLMKIEWVELHLIALPLVQPFETSFGRVQDRPCILVAAHAEGLTGWGECTAAAEPSYSYETVETAWHVLRDFLVPAVLGQQQETPDALMKQLGHVRGHPMAKAALEHALWDIAAQSQGVSLATLLGGTRKTVPVGVSVGIEPTLDDLLARVASFVEQGYQRVKLKIKPGWDTRVVQAVREQWPSLPLQVDANAAYTLSDAPIFRDLDNADLLLIEQPLHHDDIVDHAVLQTQIHTPICLDESIHSPEHARWALDMDACRVINIKPGRVGGLAVSRHIHDLCQERGVPVWCGGMLETNIGRAANLALASLPNFLLPGDISASARYYAQDIAGPDFVLNADSTITVPSGPGIGVTVDTVRLGAVRQRHLLLRH